VYIDEHGRKILVGQEALDHFAKGISRLLENRKLHYRTTFQDLPISVENRKGSIRRGKDPDGNEWETKHKVPYGYIPGTQGPDGDAVDVFVGKNPDAAFAYVIHINNPKTGEYDEYKVFLGFDTASDAVSCFRNHYDEPHKFFRRIEQIPMWKFQNKIWVKKETAKRLVASTRFFESKKGGEEVRIPLTILIRVVSRKLKKGSKSGAKQQGKQAYIPAGMFSVDALAESKAGASLQVPQEYFGEDQPNYGGQAHIFTGKRELLGHHQDIMLDPQTREGGPGSGPRKGKGKKEPPKKWGSDKRAALSELPPAKASDLAQALRTENLAIRERIRSGHWSDAQIKSARDRISQNEEMIAHYDQQREAREHGVGGMKWGVRHVRKDAAGQKHPTTGKPQHAMKRDLLHDPKTLSMMQHVSKGQAALAHYNAQRANAKANGQPTKDPKSAHQDALNAMVKELGWKLAGAAGRAVGLGGAVDHIQSILRSPSGQKLFLNTDKQGNHSMSMDKKGNRKIRTSRESGSFDRKMGRFLREAGRIYYARSMQNYGSNREADDLDLLEESFPGDKIDFPGTKRHASLGMGHFHKKINKAREVVISPLRRRRITAGVFSEAQHALHKGKKVHMLYEGRLRRVKRLELLEDGNPSGEYARVILRKEKKSKS
jgi:Inorganic Pyrophosphatase